MDYTGVVIVPPEIVENRVNSNPTAVAYSHDVEDPSAPAVAFRMEAPHPGGTPVWQSPEGAYVLVEDEDDVVGWKPQSVHPKTRWVNYPQAPMPTDGTPKATAVTHVRPR